MEQREKKLEVNNLIISFRTTNGKVQAVRDVSFDLYKGETLAIVGESGSGKSVTNRAIMGILANNAIVESGEIIYDGQDLLKISEEDFHKLRGDKIAMIFQDPMSSLNPIMRVGKQLTEAMILKGKASQKNARNEFNARLKFLREFMDAADKKDGVSSGNTNLERCKTFDGFCINSCRLEDIYNEASRAATELSAEIEDFLFMLDKNQKIDVRARLKTVAKLAKASIHPFVIAKTTGVMELISEIVADRKSCRFRATTVSDICRNHLESLKTLADDANSRTHPNFFRIGYVVLRKPDENIYSMDIDELNENAKKFLDEDFLQEFIKSAARGIQYSHDTSIERKRKLIKECEDFVDFFKNNETDKKSIYLKLSEISEKLDKAIDRLAILKNSREYTFHSSMLSWLEKYYHGIKFNPKEQARFDKQSARRDALVKRGKEPDWKVVPPALVDLELMKATIISVVIRLKESLENDINTAPEFDSRKQTIAFIDDLKDKASAAVYKMTRRMAKVKALKLLSEVGIPEPSVRYKQYPFEFSGGMRQRIVIAIALAANPDILICDEPTTALDVTIQSQILELINKLKAERHLSVIFITHDLGVVANMADRIAVMYAGKIVEFGTADDVFYDPRHPYTWALLSSMPDLDTKEKLEAIPGTPPNMIYPPKGDAFAARNKYAMEIDFEEQPPMFEISPTHYAATWLLHPEAPKVDPPKSVTDRIARMKARMAKTDAQDKSAPVTVADDSLDKKICLNEAETMVVKTAEPVAGEAQDIQAENFDWEERDRREISDEEQVEFSEEVGAAVEADISEAVEGIEDEHLKVTEISVDSISGGINADMMDKTISSDVENESEEDRMARIKATRRAVKRRVNAAARKNKDRR